MTERPLQVALIGCGWAGTRHARAVSGCGATVQRLLAAEAAQHADEQASPHGRRGQDARVPRAAPRLLHRVGGSCATAARTKRSISSSSVAASAAAPPSVQWASVAGASTTLDIVVRFLRSTAQPVAGKPTTAY